ncbi:hypothetical protein SKAU_G00364210, partial [Synaphobranchus kaupii]
ERGERSLLVHFAVSCGLLLLVWRIAGRGELYHTGSQSPSLSRAQFGAAMDLAPGLTFLIILPLFLHTNGLYIASSVDSLQHVLGEYGLVTPVSTDAEGRYLSHVLSAGRSGGQPHRRWRREAGPAEPQEEEEDEEDEEEVRRDGARPRDRLFYNVTVFGREFHLRLRHNARLVAPGAKVEWRNDDDDGG